MSDGQMTYEDWLRGCVHHDGRHGYVTLPCDEVLKIADFIERLRADRKTENSSEKPNHCEHITEDGVTCAKYPACDDCLDNPLNKVKGSERLVKGSEQTEPKQGTDCTQVDWKDRMWAEAVKDEPQTMLNDGTLVINVEDATKVGRVLVGDDKNRGDLYYPDDEDEPQTDCAWK